MLFRTVYGLELEAIYQIIWNCNNANIYPSKEEICTLVLPTSASQTVQSSHTVEDALSFLHSAGMICDEPRIRAIFDLENKTFRLRLLQQLVLIWKGMIPPVHYLDPLFIQLLDELYISPDKLFIQNVHQEVNQLKIVKTAGGISNEKVQAWKRVLEFLGIGMRIRTGFLCSYEPSLLQLVISDWVENQGVLQDFLENHFSQYLPFGTKLGGIALSASIPLEVLERGGYIELMPLQDSPSHFYFGSRKLRGIRRIGEK